MARASSRLATLAQAISSTKPTAPSQHEQRRTDVADHAVLIGVDAEAALGPIASGIPRAELVRRDRQLRLACASVTPGFSRPRTGSNAPGRSLFGSSWNGVQTCGLRTDLEMESAQDADDGVRLAAQGDRPADDVGSLPKREVQNPSLRIATLPASGRSSSGENVRPRMVGAPNRRKKSAETCPEASCSGKLAARVVHHAGTVSRRRPGPRPSARASARILLATRRCRNPAAMFMNITSRSGSGNGTGFSSTAFTTEKIAVLIPMPSVSAAIAAIVNAGLRGNSRSECAKSLKNASICRG